MCFPSWQHMNRWQWQPDLANPQPCVVWFHRGESESKTGVSFLMEAAKRNKIWCIKIFVQYFSWLQKCVIMSTKNPQTNQTKTHWEMEFSLERNPATEGCRVWRGKNTLGLFSELTSLPRWSLLWSGGEFPSPFPCMASDTLQEEVRNRGSVKTQRHHVSTIAGQI